jgi:sphingomyelin phosphodiesterase
LISFLCCRYEGVIAAQFFGHTHFDSWQIFYDVDDGFKRPVSVAYVGPSVTPLSALNMGYRVYEIDGFYPGSSWVSVVYWALDADFMLSQVSNI